MSELFLPDGQGGYVQEVRRIEVPPVEIPKHLQEDLAMNSKLEPQFYTSVQRALDASFQNPATAMREPTALAIKDRIEKCYEAIVLMRNDLGFPLKKCFDLLPNALIEALVGGERVEDRMAYAGRDPKFWAGNSAPAVTAVDTSDDDMALEEGEADE